MRLLVVDGSRLLVSLVRRLVREPIDVEVADSFEEALAVLMRDPPDALIVNVTPADHPWGELKAVCQRHEPKIPVIFESCVYQTPLEAGLGNLNHSAAFLPKPYELEALRGELARLLAEHFDRDSESQQPGSRPRP